MARGKDGIRQKTEDYYIENIDTDAREIAELFNVHYDTVRGWIKKYDWEDKRWSFNSSPTIIKQKLQQEAHNIVNGGKPNFSADAVNKIMSAIEKIDKSADPVIIHKVLKDLDNFISETDPAFATECTKYHKRFLQHRISIEQ